MQVILRRADLGEQQPVVLAHYPDGTTIKDITVFGNGVTIMTVPDTGVVPSSKGGGYTLASNWRSYADVIVNAEAKRRIDLVFKDYSQSNANQDTIASIMKYGTDEAAWPSDAKKRKASAEVGWNFINSVRQRSDAMVAGLPIDPTDNSHWPTQIEPVNISQK